MSSPPVPAEDAAAVGAEPMPPGVRLLAGTAAWEAMADLPPFPPFDPQVVEFLDALAGALVHHPEARLLPDVVAFAYFCRRRAVEVMAAPYAAYAAGALGRGVSFHVTPANVPINFAYSLAAGLLAGTRCVVRVSSRPFAQTAIVCEALQAVLARPAFAALREAVSVVTYGHDAAVTARFSARCDVRVVWGGDVTIGELRRAPLPPRAVEVPFADRASVCVVDAAGYLALPDHGRVARDFFNDTYLFDQRACSSPRLVYWLGAPGEVARAQRAFWGALTAVLDAKGYALAPVTVVDKLVALSHAVLRLEGARLLPTTDMRLHRLALARLTPEALEGAGGSGAFLEFASPTLEAFPVLATRKLQTVTCVGMDPAPLRAQCVAWRVAGADRVVPNGQAAAFALTWDGFDLIRQLSRPVGGA